MLSRKIIIILVLFLLSPCYLNLWGGLVKYDVAHMVKPNKRDKNLSDKDDSIFLVFVQSFKKKFGQTLSGGLYTTFYNESLINPS